MSLGILFLVLHPQDSSVRFCGGAPCCFSSFGLRELLVAWLLRRRRIDLTFLRDRDRAPKQSSPDLQK